MSDFENEEGHAACGSVSLEASNNTAGSDQVINAATAHKPEPLPDPKWLPVYAANGYEMIPLHRFDAVDSKGKPIGKQPLKTGWRTMPAISLAEAGHYMAKGHNIGIRMRDGDLIVDVDPRNFDNSDAFERFQAEFGLDWAPVVLTGGGGQHWYFRKPEDLKLRSALESYRGVEIKTAGQVLVAGSIHPDSRRLYEFDPLSLSLSEVTEAPGGLLMCLTANPSASCSDVTPELDTGQLTFILSHLNAEDFRDQKLWQDVMMAAHHITGGDGLEAFVEWSTSDPVYSEHGEDIAKRWKSLRQKPGGITGRYLFKVLPEGKRREVIEAVYRTDPADDFGDDIEVEPKPVKVRKNYGLYDEWVWLVVPYVFVRRSDGMKFKPEQWKSIYAGLMPDSDIVTAVFKNKVPVRKCETLVYEPCKPEFPDGENGRSYNLWKPSGVEAHEGDVSIFLEHMTFLFPDEVERSYVLDYLALLTQKPEMKINFALLIRGAQGTGKSWIGNLMERIIGKPNISRPNNDEVNSRWTAWMEGAQLAILEELMAVGRKEIANRLKPIITDDTLRIEDKGCRLYSIPNHLNLLCFSNHEDAVYLEQGDRRWLVVFSPAGKQPSDYYDKLFGYLNEGGATFVKHWLMQRHIGLNPKGVAPVTKGKTTMRNLSLNDVEAFLLERFEASEAPFDFDLVRLEDVVAHIPSTIRGAGSLNAKIARFMRSEFGAVIHGRYTKSDDKNRPSWTLWSVRNHDQWDKAGAAARIDAFMAELNRQCE